MNETIYRHAAIETVRDVCKRSPTIAIRAMDALRKLPSAQPEQLWIPCGKCIHADGKHRWCKVLDRSINEDYFCCWAEPWKEGEAE